MCCAWLSTSMDIAVLVKTGEYWDCDMAWNACGWWMWSVIARDIGDEHAACASASATDDDGEESVGDAEEGGWW